MPRPLPSSGLSFLVCEGAWEWAPCPSTRRLSQLRCQEMQVPSCCPYWEGAGGPTGDLQPQVRPWVFGGRAR